MNRVFERIREANAPKPAEGSLRLRLACVAAVAAGLAAAAAEGEISRAAALLAGVLVAAGTAFSHLTRHRPAGRIKLVVASGALAVAGEFLHRIYQTASGGLAGVEGPLAVLLASILVVHSWHVPARRDLVFALAGSAALVAVAAATAVDTAFAGYALLWSAAAFWALVECGASVTGARPVTAHVAAAAAGAGAIGLLAFLALPAPVADVSLDFPAATGTAGLEPQPGALAGDAGRPNALSRPGTPAGPTRVGGYLGFAGDLDTAVRAGLGHQVVMQVRATFPTFWVGETYNRWDGQSWSSTLGKSVPLGGGSPYEIDPAPLPPTGAALNDVQTFYVESDTADLVFHADQAQQVWFPAPELFVGPDDSIVSPIGLGPGAIYTVESSVERPGPADLLGAGVDPRFPTGLRRDYTELPRPYTRVRRLVATVTEGDTDEYSRVEALIAWVGDHTRYSTDIPPLPAGADAVDEFLFGSRVGYCEQISTALAVMLRTLGIPAREAVGYVPGSYDPLTDLYQVHADDAHAWVQVWFPTYGWVNFDPTASVPSANPTPGVVVADAVGRILSSLPWPAIGETAAATAAAGAVGGAVAAARHRRARARLTPAGRAVAQMEAAGRRAGLQWAESQTVAAYAAELGGGWPAVAGAVDASAYGGMVTDTGEWDRLLAQARAEPP